MTIEELLNNMNNQLIHVENDIKKELSDIAKRLDEIHKICSLYSKQIKVEHDADGVASSARKISQIYMDERCYN